MIVGSLGVLVNGAVFQSLMKTKIGAKKVVTLPLIRSLEPLKNRWENITIAWGIGILAAFVFNFLLNKYLVFGV